MKSMKLSQYYEVINPTYEYLKIIPHSSIRNYNSSVIAKMVSNMYKSIKKRIEISQRKLIITAPLKCTYVIDIQKTDVSFYFVVPSQYVSLAKERILSTWNKAKIEIVSALPSIKGNVYQVKYKNKDQLSLDVDKKSNYPLNSILNTIDIMEDNDHLFIAYNFIPTSNYGWKSKCDAVKHDYEIGNSVSRELSGKAIAFKCIFAIADFMDQLLDEFFKSKDINVFVDLKQILNSKINTVSSSTVAKSRDSIIKTQIAVISSSENDNRAISNAISVCEGFEELEGDNKLEYETLKLGSINVLEHTFKGIETNTFSVNECQNLIQLPGKELLEEHHISHNNVIETDVPKELRTGVMCIGENICKENKTKAYLSTDKSFQYLTWLLIGPTRAGKTTLISNTILDSSLAGETNIVLDWCGKCELSRDIKTALKGKVKIFDIDCSDMRNSQGLGYNELYSTSSDPDERYISAKKQSMKLITLVNCLQGGDEDLRARMERYLGAASLVVAMNNGPIKDVFEILQDHVLRYEYINNIPSNQLKNMAKYINYLKELDEHQKNSDIVIGTKLNAVQGILNRISKLEQNPYMEMMMQKDCRNNINLVDEMQKGELIIIEMNEDMFSTDEETDIYATYWITKIWGALQKRKMTINENDAVKVNIYFDELYQVENCQLFLKSILSQMAKFWAKPIISCHYIEQICGIRNELRSANASYTIISGSDKKNYAELKSELQPYQESDLLNLKRHYAINLIKCDDGYGKFITKLPGPIVQN